MPAAHRSRNAGIVAASLAVHAAVIAVLWLQAPRLRVPVSELGPPEAIIPVLIMPRAPPPAAAPGTKPAPIRLHRRPQRFALEPLPIKPLAAPETPQAPKAASAPGPRTLTLPSSEDPIAANARKALRGRLGCSSANLMNLSRAEREACENGLAAGGREAPFPGLGVDRDKARTLDAAAARREADYNYKRSIKPSAPAGASLPWDTNRGPEGQAETLGKSIGNDRPKATVPF
jgi:hypothetical protein